MSDPSIIERLETLGRRLIADQMKMPRAVPLVGAAFDGSLATRRAWPTSDLDFTIFPVASAAPEDPAKVPAYRFYYTQGPLARHNLFVELRFIEGAFVNMHCKSKESLEALRDDYPNSFIESADWVPGDLESTHFIDGLAIMNIVEDPEGYLAKTKAFVSERRFAPEVLRPRLERMAASGDRILRESRAKLAEGDLPVSAAHDLARCAAQMWLEAHSRIYSKKEQDALLAEVTREAKATRVHELYRATLGLDLEPARLKNILGPISEYGNRVDMMFGIVESMAAAHAERIGADVVERVQAYRIWARLTLQSIPIAFEKGCYAHMAFSLDGVGPNALSRLTTLIEKVAPEQAPAIEQVCRAEMAQSHDIWELFGQVGIQVPGQREARARQLDAATELLAMTKQRLLA